MDGRIDGKIIWRGIFVVLIFSFVYGYVFGFSVIDPMVPFIEFISKSILLSDTSPDLTTSRSNFQFPILSRHQILYKKIIII